MFLGQYDHNIDEKGRLTIPSRYREDLASGAYITQGFEKNLLVFMAKSFIEIAESVNKKSLTDPQARELRRRIFSRADQVEVDRSGRILLPQFLREKNGLDGEVVIAGNGTYFEIWSKPAWAEQEAKIDDTEANQDRYAAIDLLIGAV